MSEDTTVQSPVTALAVVACAMTETLELPEVLRRMADGVAEVASR